MGKTRSVFQRSGIHLGILLGFALLIFLADSFHLFEAQELGFIDLRFQLRGSREPHPGIVIVEIDDESIRRIGHWPWPRGYHATLLNVLSAYKPRFILYDVLFTEASLDANEDTLLAYGVKKAGNVVAPFFFHSENPLAATFPIPAIREAAWVLGFVNIFPERDGHIRRIKSSIHPKEGTFYHTSVAAILTQIVDGAEGREWVRKIPLDRENSFWINFPGDYSLFPRLPFYRVIQKKGAEDPELRELLEGKMIVVGQTATGGGDFRPTSFSPAYPGVGIQAAALHTLLTGQHLRRAGIWFSLVILLAATLLVAYLTWKNPPRLAILAVLVLTVFYLGWNFLAFSFLGWIFPVLPVLLAVVGSYLLALFLQFLDVRLEGELLSREISWAARIQENFLPQAPPALGGVEVGYHCRFARMVGGDLYDWIPLGKNRIGICVGDVSGKGVPAALYMARVISELRAIAKDFESPAALLEALNVRLTASPSEGIFVTVLYLILDLEAGSLVLSNAGHEPLCIYRKREGKLEWVREGAAQPVGMFPETHYPEARLSVGPGDYAVLISDGVRELRNPRGEEFGLEGTGKSLNSLSMESADQVVKRVFAAMEAFAKGNPAHDDRTVLCVRITDQTLK